jgi:hypothetical protein
MFKIDEFTQAIDNVLKSKEKSLLSFKTKPQRIEGVVLSFAKIYHQGSEIRVHEYYTFYSTLLILYLNKVLAYENNYLIELETLYLNKVNQINTCLNIGKNELSSDLYLWAITHNDEKLAQFLKGFGLTFSIEPHEFWHILLNSKYLTQESIAPEINEQNTCLKEKIQSDYIISLICVNYRWLDFYYDNIENKHQVQFYSQETHFFDYLNFFEQVNLEKNLLNIAYQAKIDITQATKRTTFKNYQLKSTEINTGYIPSENNKTKLTRNFWREDEPVHLAQLKVYKDTPQKTENVNNQSISTISALVASIKPSSSSHALIHTLIIKDYEKLHALNFDEQKDKILSQLSKLSDYIESNLYLFTYHHDKLKELNKNIYTLIELCHAEYFNDEVFKIIDLINLVAFVYPSLIKSYIVMLSHNNNQNQTHNVFKTSINKIIYLVETFKSHLIATIEKNFQLASDEIEQKFSQFSFQLRYNEEKEIKLL